jgi:NTP pyrophosphatase (non-canonical NTP hydrolase)
MDIEAIRNQLRSFAADRDWDQFHTPKNLSSALSVEAAELLEIFQWLTPEESATLDESQRQRVTEEVADILIFAVSCSCSYPCRGN